MTWNGHRELLYYLSNEEATAAALKALSSKRAFAFTCDGDEKWAKVDYWLNR